TILPSLMITGKGNKSVIGQCWDWGKNEIRVKNKMAAASVTRPERDHRQPQGMQARSQQGV
ncbi:hypothetical protein, partial [Hafnia paralvei]|uniref:hypothetical protein n=1 Tax=Hafnia paralvei TaxID=546367 RepID=UPI001D1195A9